MAPPGGLDFPLWLLPGDQEPYHGIVLIFFQIMQSPLKGQPVKNVLMVEHYYPMTITFMLVIRSSLKKKVDFFEVGHTVGSASISNFSANSNLYSKRL
jgi:hypothetical protein